MKKKVNPRVNPRIQISISMPKMLVQDMDGLIDMITIRSRSHLIQLAVLDYIDSIKKKIRPTQLSISDIKSKKKKS